jgi:hypothetical protein
VFSWGAVEGTGRKKKYRKKVETKQQRKFLENSQKDETIKQITRIILNEKPKKSFQTRNSSSQNCSNFTSSLSLLDQLLISPFEAYLL